MAYWPWATCAVATVGTGDVIAGVDGVGLGDTVGLGERAVMVSLTPSAGPPCGGRGWL